MKVACIQLSSGENYNKNCKQIIYFINQAIRKKADLIITPETSSIITSDKKKLFNNSYPMKKDPLVKDIKKIKEVNLKLWNIEDKIRICEKNKDFGETFIDLARSVYVNNDKRAQIKSEINKRLGSNIKEIKQYVDY